MKRYLTLVIFIPIILLLSCETDESRKEKCINVVNTFMSNLPLDNYEVLLKNYPDLREIENYWKINKYEIKNTSIDEDKSVSIICSTELGNIFFNLEKVDNKYIIKNSKGLSSAFNTPLYNFCKQIGCIGTSEYDKDISRICADKEIEFVHLVKKAKESIESNVVIANNNLKINYGYISGDLVIKNQSRFSIPGNSYQLYYHFINSSGQIVFTKNEILNYENIPFGQSITKSLFESSTGDFRKIRVELKLKETNFIEEVIAEHIMGTNCTTNGDY